MKRADRLLDGAVLMLIVAIYILGAAGLRWSLVPAGLSVALGFASEIIRVRVEARRREVLLRRIDTRRQRRAEQAIAMSGRHLAGRTWGDA